MFSIISKPMPPSKSFSPRLGVKTWVEECVPADGMGPLIGGAVSCGPVATGGAAAGGAVSIFLAASYTCREVVDVDRWTTARAGGPPPCRRDSSSAAQFV